MIFQIFQEWKDEINKIRQTTRDLNEILNASQSVLPHMFSIVDDEFNFIAKTTDFFKRYPNFSETPDRISLDIANEFFFEEEFQYAKEHKGVFLYAAKSPLKSQEDIGLCYNIFVGGNYYARLTVEVPGKENMPGERYFVKCLGEIITEMCSESENENLYEKDDISFQETIRLFVNGNFQDKNAVKTILNTRGWELEHQYQVLKFKFGREGYILYYCRHIEKLFGNCCAVHMGDGIYCIENISLTSKEGGEKEKFNKQLPYFVRENLCKVGISNVFEDIFQLSTYCREADIALKLGERIDKHFWYYYFSKYTMNHIIDQCTSILPTYNICHDAVKILIKYDEKNDTELYNTLYELIKCKYNITHAAKALFIHRTTLIQRLDRIKQLTKITLEDYEERLYLMLSYYMVEHTPNKAGDK